MKKKKCKVDETQPFFYSERGQNLLYCRIIFIAVDNSLCKFGLSNGGKKPCFDFNDIVLDSIKNCVAFCSSRKC